MTASSLQPPTDTQNVMVDRLVQQLMLGLLAGIMCAAAIADWPSRPIRFVVPYPPGGPLDAVARMAPDG